MRDPRRVPQLTVLSTPRYTSEEWRLCCLCDTSILEAAEKVGVVESEEHSAVAGREAEVDKPPSRKPPRLPQSCAHLDLGTDSNANCTGSASTAQENRHNTSNSATPRPAWRTNTCNRGTEPTPSPLPPLGNCRSWTSSGLDCTNPHSLRNRYAFASLSRPRHTPPPCSIDTYNRDTRLSPAPPRCCETPDPGSRES